MKEYAEDYSTAELVCVAVAREVEDGDILILGSFTPLAFVSYILAKLTHAPNVMYMAYSSVDARPFQLSFASYEAAATKGGVARWNMTECINSLYLGIGVDVEPISSIQADQYGNINISVVGDYQKPVLRGPGGAGAPEVVKMHRKMIGYFPNHSKRTLVPKVDFVTGTRWKIGNEARRKAGLRPGPLKYITNLAILSKEEEGKPFKIESVHPGVSVTQVIENTGFELTVPKDVPQTEKPTKEQIRLLREEIDPYGIVAFDFMPGKERLAYLKQILDREVKALAY
jgi:acyl CoA:acetate/3-ketoacid CoA transferase beta subunit